jgi:histidinol-phosphatase (PHP family)
MQLPPDSHVHSEWSWDTPVGDMERSCARAVELGLPGIAFTEHVDHTVWRVELQGVYASDHLTAIAAPDGMLTPPAFDAVGYLEAIEHCRDRFPGLRILSGLELGEPHRHAEACAKVLAAGRFDHVLGSVHALPDQGVFAEPWGIYPHRDAREVVRDYLAEIATLVKATDAFSVLAHIDYPVRSWPQKQAGSFDPSVFGGVPVRTGGNRAVRAALETNTRIPLHATILRWWHEEGGDAVTFGSDAHLPAFVGHGFAEAAQMAEAHGFRPGKNPYDVWGRAN